MRREHVLAPILAIAVILAWSGGPVSAGRPNVVFIAIDDLNDWLGCLDGHPDAKTTK